MLIHTHVYYSNRFEPGTLFPDTYRIDRSELLEVIPAQVMHVNRYDKSIGLDNTKNIVSFPTAKISTIPSMGYTLLFIIVPSKDFNLNESIKSTTGARSFVSDVYPMEFDYGTMPKDFIFIDPSESMQVNINISSTSVSNAIKSSSHSLTII